MKKIKLLLLASFSLLSTEIFAQTGYGNYGYLQEERNGMSFGVWYVKNSSSQTGYAIVVKNLSEEVLKLRLLKLQIEDLERKAMVARESQKSVQRKPTTKK